MTAGLLTVVVTLAAIPVMYAVIRVAMLALQPHPAARASERAAILFARGVSPAFGAFVLAFGVVLPAFVLFEPPHDGEHVGRAMLLLAAVGAAQIAWTAFRFFSIIRVSRDITSTWRRHARPMHDNAWGMRTYAIDAAFPVVAVSGFMRPTLFVDSRVLATCSPPELAAIAAHERAHVTSRDNIRRLLIGSCAGAGSAIASRWREAAEHAADDRAASDASRAVDLASALLKVARLAPAGSFERTALSTVHDGGDFETRIKRLLASRDASPRRPFAPLVLAASISTLTLVLLNLTAVLSSVHAVTETFVRLLR